MKRGRLLLIAALLAVAAAILVPTVAMVVDAERAKASETVNAPDILIDQPGLLTFPDPMHIKLPDGRTFRLAHVIAPAPNTPDYKEAMELVWMPLKFGGNQKRGLRTIGTNAQGETLVEMWGFQPSLGGCGNMTWSERRAARIPHWKHLTWQLLSSGYYRLEPGVQDKELIAWENVAKREAQGVWANPQTLQQVFDLDELKQTLEGSSSYGTPAVREKRLEAADVLLRADAKTYVPVLLGVVRNPQEKDVFVRIRVAQLLDKAGQKEGTAYLMNALRTGGRGSGLDEYALNSVVLEYQTYWNVHTFSHDDHAAILKHYDAQVKPAGGTSRPKSGG